MCTAQALIPKQYLEMLGQPIAMYSLQTLAAMREFGEVIIVCEPSYQVRSALALFALMSTYAPLLLMAQTTTK